MLLHSHRYLKRARPARGPERAVVVSFGTSGFTVFVPELGLTSRLFLEDIGKEGELLTSLASVVWRPNAHYIFCASLLGIVRSAPMAVVRRTASSEGFLCSSTGPTCRLRRRPAISRAWR